jgi:hypothetical protein
MQELNKFVCAYTSHDFQMQFSVCFAAQFFVDTGTDNVNANNLLYRFRPVNQPKKYLAVSGSKIILKVKLG